MRVWVQKTAIVLTCFGLVLPSTPSAAAPPSQNDYAGAMPVRPGVADVVLSDADQLTGQVVDGNGSPLAHTVVQLSDESRVVVTVRSDAEGYFQIPISRGGLYQLTAGGSVSAWRVWQTGTAPPSAVASALVVADEDVVRGLGMFTGILFHPWVIAGSVFAGIAVAIGIDDGGAS